MSNESESLPRDPIGVAQTIVHSRSVAALAIDISSPHGPDRRVSITDRVSFGREGVAVVLSDPSVSRRHVAVEPDPHGPGVIVTDLGSRNGTRVNSKALRGPTVASSGDRIELGDTVLTVVAPVAMTTPDSRRVRDGVRVEARAGTPAGRVRGDVEEHAARAWKRLVGLLPEGTRVEPLIRLVDPFPDPSDPGRTIGSGSVIDDERNEIWSVATAEVAPDEPGRTLARLVAHHLQLGPDDDISMLLEGYGLHASGVPNTDGIVRNLGTVPPSRATADARSVGAVSFVRFLLDRESEENFRTLLRTTKATELDAALNKLFGRGLAGLEQAWQNRLSATASGDVKPRQFLSLALRYLRPYRWKQVEIFAYMVLGLSFSAVLPFVSKSLFDDAIPSGKFSRVVTQLLVLAGAFAVSLLATLRQTWCSAIVSGSVVRDLREQMFQRLQFLPLSWFGRYQQGEVISRMFNDVRAVEGGLSQIVGAGISQVLALILSTVIMMRVQPVLGAVVLVAVPFVALIYRRMSAGALARSLILQEEQSSLLSLTAENYSAQPVVKLFGLHGWEQLRFTRAGARAMRAERRVTMFGGLFGLSVNSVLTILRLVVLGLGSWLILHDRLSLGGLVAFLGVMGEVISPATSLTQLGQTVQRSGGSLLRINEILETETEEDDPNKPLLSALQNSLTLENVTFTYQPGTPPALVDLTCSIAAGSKVAFVGPSGSGKSTILRLLMRLDEPTSGRITFDGTDIRERSIASLRSQLGVVLQESFLFNASIRDNIALGALTGESHDANPSATDAEIAEAAAAAEIDEFIRALPQGYATPVGDRGGRLSGGQRQRVSIARAILRKPRVLLLDEATSALDPATERQINATLDRVGADRTTIAITHRLTSVTNFDRIFVIDAGRLVEEGTHSELLKLGGTYAHLWYEQTGEAPPQTQKDVFDARAALAAVAMFGDLPPEALDEVVARLSPITLREGDEVSEDQGDLWLVESGHPTVLVPSAGTFVPAGDLETGDVFGLAALLGDPQGRRLRASLGTQLLQLRGWSVDALCARYPSLRPQNRTEHDGPPRGTRITRVTSTTSLRALLRDAASNPASRTADAAGEISAQTGTNRHSLDRIGTDA